MTKKRLENRCESIMSEIKNLRESGKGWAHLEKKLDNALDRLTIEHFTRGVNNGHSECHYEAGKLRRCTKESSGEFPMSINGAYKIFCAGCGQDITGINTGVRA